MNLLLGAEEAKVFGYGLGSLCNGELHESTVRAVLIGK